VSRWRVGRHVLDIQRSLNCPETGSGTTVDVDDRDLLGVIRAREVAAVERSDVTHLEALELEEADGLAGTEIVLGVKAVESVGVGNLVVSEAVEQGCDRGRCGAGLGPSLACGRRVPLGSPSRCGRRLPLWSACGRKL